MLLGGRQRGSRNAKNIRRTSGGGKEKNQNTANPLCPPWVDHQRNRVSEGTRKSRNRARHDVLSVPSVLRTTGNFEKSGELLDTGEAGAQDGSTRLQKKGGKRKGPCARSNEGGGKKGTGGTRVKKGPRAGPRVLKNSGGRGSNRAQN